MKLNRIVEKVDVHIYMYFMLMKIRFLLIVQIFLFSFFNNLLWHTFRDIEIFNLLNQLTNRLFLIFRNNIRN